MIIAPSILSSDFANLETEIKRLEENGADWVHVDVMDGHFVPNLTIGAPVVKAIKPVTKLPMDVHLMIENPAKYVKDFALAGADIITFHYEATKETTFEVINIIKSYGVKVGISIKPKTPVSAIKPYLDMVDLVLIMTVEPGFGGQEFMQSCVTKLAYYKSLNFTNIYLEVDGGINAETAKIVKQNGANVLVAGSYVYSAIDTKSAIESLKIS